MADMVTCGVAPGIIMAQLFVMAGNKPIEIPLGWPLNTVVEFIPWVFIGFLILWALLLDWLDSILMALKKIIYRFANTCNGDVFWRTSDIGETS